jgi:hypothetical protein
LAAGRVFIVFFVRVKLSELLERLTSFKGPAGIEMSFGRYVVKLEVARAVRCLRPRPPRFGPAPSG